MVRVKICGITNLEDALAAAEEGADAVGFVFYPKSPRYIEPGEAGRISSALPPFVARVGVFVDEEFERIVRIARRCRLDYVQLHGSEPPEMCRRLREAGLKVIKAFRVRDEGSLRGIGEYEADAYLLDAYAPDRPGGTGLTFRWAVAYNLDVDRRRLIVAGGLTPENVRDVIEMLRPWAVDVSSGVEIEPGRKDRGKIRRFIAAVKGGA